MTEARRRVWLVRGQVQGVGFRAFARRAAVGLGLAGSATNLPDGQVEVVAFGAEAALSELEKRLRRGPSFGRVDRVDCVEESDEADPPSDFTVR